MKLKPDFGGYATKSGLKCSDGRTILPNAFKEMDGQTVPLVWQHLHNEVGNVLGHALLESREDGVYAHCFCNATPAGQNAKVMVQHKDLKSLSIYANDLKQKGKDVLHGVIREVSLVLSGANPGALIDFISLQHGDDFEESDDEAIIYTGLDLEHSDKNDVDEPDPVQHGEEETVEDVINSMTDKQKDVLYALVSKASEGVEHSEEEGDKGIVKKNVFEGKEADDKMGRPTLTHDQLQAIMDDAKKNGSLKDSFLAHAVTYGIENIEYLFPDARTLRDSPDFVSRRMEWVSSVLNGSTHSPFSRIKSMSADITLDDARARGYIKGSLKKEEFFALSRRTTTPTTIYKKQKLDRDDIIDIVDLDVVAWLKEEMRVMLDEEIARAALIGDGRPVDILGSANEDKIDETKIRPIALDADFYAHRVTVAPNTSGSTLVEAILRERHNYKGSGNPTFFTSDSVLVDLLLIKDRMGRRLYATEQELAAALRVSSIVAVEVMENYEIDGLGLLGIMVNMKDYTFGADKGGQVSMFDDFDIDYNQQKYLIETRCCGCLTRPKSALVFWRGTGTQATVTAPTFVAGTNTVTIPSATGVVYYLAEGDDTPAIHAAGTHVISEDTVVTAEPDTGYFFGANTTVEWEFLYTE